MTTPVFGVTGWKNSGKTTLTERLVAELARRGRKVATVKHAHHSFDVDREGTDSFRHRAAGANEVAIVASSRWALMHELRSEDEPSLAAILARLSPADIVIVEGFKREGHAKIECCRAEAKDHAALAGNVPGIVAIAADHDVAETDLPVFALDDVPAIADFVERHCGLS